MTRIADLRRKLAAIILGEQTAFFVPTKEKVKMETGQYLDLPDDVLGSATRRWFLAIEQAHAKRAEQEDRPVAMMTSQHAVLALASMSRDVNAETMNFVVRGSIDGGKTERVFEVQFRYLADDYQFSPIGVQTITDPNDPDKIIQMTISLDNPAYDAWKKDKDSDPA